MEFTSTNKTGGIYHYKVIDIIPAETVQHLDWVTLIDHEGDEMEVEPEWFRQRKIEFGRRPSDRPNHLAQRRPYQI
ncbi:hypothetical protein D3C76_1681600 [compost metagenome]